MKTKILFLSALILTTSTSLSSIPAHSQVPERGFAELVKKVGGGVVNISTFARPKLFRRGLPGGFQGPMDPNDPFRNFFEEFFGGRIPGPRPEAPPQTRPQKSQPFALGTGFVIDESGLILTNHHVIGGAEEVKIQFNEDDEFVAAEIIGRDPELDVALLSVRSKAKLTPIPLGDSDRIEVGEYVLAIGNPLGYGHTVTHGILSAKERKAPEMRLAKYLQTDASINPGNSGGPLLNMRGEVIGINNAIDARAQGIGFAIPINTVKQILPQLKTKGTVSRGYLGVSAGELSEEMASELQLPSGTKGVMIAEVIPGEAADRAGLKPYDVITSVNGEKIASPIDLTTKITSVKVGDSAEIRFFRKGKEKTLKVKLGERPSQLAAGEQVSPSTPEKKKKPSDSPIKEWGFEAEEMSESLAREFGLPLDNAKKIKGVVVTDLAFGKAAAESGLNRGDLILDVGGREIKSLSDLEEALRAVKGKSTMVRTRKLSPNGDGSVSVIVLKKD
ncbi:MAG: trypsin-like peptidase domain-containing protein [Bdellovibrionales bacterium]|nr:trypsin-like peptidase domain-containing protein [Bdellovibrionales bacterium]